ncbi:MAG TPA: DUF72 domain-containing protein [Mycobacteriales bacterium]|nr:DUF72 domain-containing protein [Mycobacteriales bacterium]
MPVLVGTSGWQYLDWRGRFYPSGMPQRLWLEHHAARWQTVELNNSFYRLPQRETFEAWRQRTPADYLVTVKASRFLSHIKRLREPQEPVARLMDRADGLGDKLGPVLLQLPPDLQLEVERLDETLACFPAGTRVVVEPRHPSWWAPELRDVLTRHGAALCWADRGSAPVAPLWRTASWGYLRLHAGGGEPDVWPYSEAVLARWADLLCETWTEDEDVLVYTNNDPGGAALRDGVVLARLLRERGRTVGRVPGWDDVTGDPA